MISIDSITQDDIDLIGELFIEEKKEVFISNTAKFEVEGKTVKCVSSKYIHPNCEEDLVQVELKILKVKKIAEEIFGCQFIDLRKQVNN